jgi:hypothetical protein
VKMTKAQARKRVVECKSKLHRVYGWYLTSSKEATRGVSEESILRAMTALDKLHDKMK